MSELTKVRTMAEMAGAGENPEVLFWVGCAGSFDQRAQKITGALVRILNSVGVKFAILGQEEVCTGDPARRAGNEFLFQMMAMQNITTLEAYGVKKIVTACPHCFNVLKNEYPELGGTYEVIHHTQLLQGLIDQGKLKVDGGEFKGKRITFHDSCYLGRANDVYEAPRKVLEALDAELFEMRSCKSRGLCCGAGGAQMFKEEEEGTSTVNTERTVQALEVKPDVVAVGCPFCMTMLSDGVKMADKQDEVSVYDVAELIAKANHLFED
ncbi:MAG: heterodisulfide reductase subunit D [Limisphaerales bacterium]|jgi:heterodisulfide reductase subunit D